MNTKSTLLSFSFLFTSIMIGAQRSSLGNSGLTGATQDTWYQEASAFKTKIENDFYPVNGQYR
jgi:hypothetical protein